MAASKKKPKTRKAPPSPEDRGMLRTLVHAAKQAERRKAGAMPFPGRKPKTRKP